MTPNNPLEFLDIMGLALSLAMDAFAVAISAGIMLKTISRRQTFRLAFHFGLFQALMPILGWSFGLTIRGYVEAIDHWIVFGLLGYVSITMFRSAFSKKTTDEAPKDPTRGWTMVMLSVATSLDALAIGLSLSLIRVSIWVPALYIGLVAGVMTTLGMVLGKLFGGIQRLNQCAEAIGAMILLIIGIRVLADHGVFSFI